MNDRRSAQCQMGAGETLRCEDVLIAQRPYSFPVVLGLLAPTCLRFIGNSNILVHRTLDTMMLLTRGIRIEIE